MSSVFSAVLHLQLYQNQLFHRYLLNILSESWIRSALYFKFRERIFYRASIVAAIVIAWLFTDFD